MAAAWRRGEAVGDGAARLTQNFRPLSAVCTGFLDCFIYDLSLVLVKRTPTKTRFN